MECLEGSEGSDTGPRAGGGDFRGDVQHEVIAVAEIDVGVAAAQKHGAVARSRSAKVMRGRVALRIGFRCHNAAAEPNAGEFTDNNFADQETGKRHGVRRQFGAAKTPDGNGSFVGCHGWQARQSSDGVKKSNLTPDQNGSTGKRGPSTRDAGTESEHHNGPAYFRHGGGLMTLRRGQPTESRVNLEGVNTIALGACAAGGGGETGQRGSPAKVRRTGAGRLPVTLKNAQGHELCRFLDLASDRLHNDATMTVRARGA